MAPLARHNPRSGDRQQDFREAMGFIAENFPFGAIASSTAPVSQDVRAGTIYLYENEVITNLHCHEATAQTTPVHFQMGLWDPVAGGAAVASSADDTTVLTTLGIITAPLSATYTIKRRGLYVVGFWIQATTVGAFGRSATGLGGGFGRKPGSTGPNYMWSLAGQVALPTYGALGAGQAGYWVAAS